MLVDRFAEFAASDDGARVKVELLDQLVSKLTSVADRHGVEPSDLASTFLCVAVSGDRFLGAHVGDGVVGYLKNGELKVISAPDNESSRTRRPLSPLAAPQSRCGCSEAHWMESPASS